MRRVLTPFQLFSRTAPNKTFAALVLGAVAGVFNALLIPLVVSSIAHRNEGVIDGAVANARLFSIDINQYRFAYAFAILCFLVLIGRWVSQVTLTRVAIDATSHLRTRIYEKVMNAPVAEVDRIGFSKIIGAITVDVLRLVEGASIVPGMIVSSISLLGIMGYLYLINSSVFMLVFSALVFGIVTFQVPIAIGNRFLRKSRSGYDAIQEGVRGLVLGGKELKLSHVKRTAYKRWILEAAESIVRKNGKRANTILAASSIYGDLLGFFVIGIITFVFTSYHAIDNQQLLGCIMALLYLATPVAVILGGITALANARVALRNIEAVIEQLPQEVMPQTLGSLLPWTSIRCAELAYAYLAPDGSPSHGIGPVTLELRRGEVVFLVGGNGSGKTTLARMLSLHYLPVAGHIAFGETVISETSIGAARESISAIYTDYYLFDRLLSIPKDTDHSMIQGYLERLGLADKVRIDDGRFSTTALSDGQRKRLALVVAFVDDRDVYIFDEWAADQDPSFKRTFYMDLLPELRKRNKVVVVISHDDRYFHVADRVLVMEDGRLAAERKASRETVTVDAV